MKKITKSVLCVILALGMLASFFTFGASAASSSVTFNSKTYKIGQQVAVTVKFTADSAVFAAELDVAYSASTLKFVSVNGADATGGNGKIKIVDDDFSTATKEVKSGSYVINFTAIANGAATVSVSGTSDGGNIKVTSATASVEVSADANLSSLRLSTGTLSPAFSPSVTKYTATVGYDVAEMTITAATSDSAATAVGPGTFSVNIGENTKTITVTAANGTKKSYTIVVKRLTKAEADALEKEKRDSDPLLITVGGNDYHIVNDITAEDIPGGYSLKTFDRKGTQINAFADNDGVYTLVYATADGDAESKRVIIAVKDEDEYGLFNYIMSGNDLYAVLEPEADFSSKKEYYPTKFNMNGMELPAIAYSSEDYSDFIILYCYFGGEKDYYRYDKEMSTLQHLPEFLQSLGTASSKVSSPSVLKRFKELGTPAKVIIILVLLAVVCIIALIVMLIVKAVIAHKTGYDDYGYYPDEPVDYAAFDNANVSSGDESINNNVTEDLPQAQNETEYTADEENSEDE